MQRTLGDFLGNQTANPISASKFEEGEVEPAIGIQSIEVFKSDQNTMVIGRMIRRTFHTFSTLCAQNWINQRELLKMDSTAAWVPHAMNLCLYGLWRNNDPFTNASCTSRSATYLVTPVKSMKFRVRKDFRLFHSNSLTMRNDT